MLRPIPAPAERSPLAEIGRAERPPQFGLKQLLLVMTWISVSLAVFVAIGPMWSAFVLLFGLLIAAHVLGNALGTRLTNSALPADEAIPCVATAAQVAELCGSGNRMHQRTKLDRPWLAAAAVGAAVGGTLGGGGLSISLGTKLTVAGLGVGIGSSAVVGGLLGFMACSLYCVARQAWREATECVDEPRTPN